MDLDSLLLMAQYNIWATQRLSVSLEKVSDEDFYKDGTSSLEKAFKEYYYFPNYFNLFKYTDEENNILDVLPDEICNLNISNTLHLENMSRLILTRKQKDWINQLKNNSRTVYADDDLFSRVIPEIDIDEDEIPF